MATYEQDIYSFLIGEIAKAKTLDSAMNAYNAVKNFQRLTEPIAHNDGSCPECGASKEDVMGGVHRVGCPTLIDSARRP